jgi:hypothetical protein
MISIVDFLKLFSIYAIRMAYSLLLMIILSAIVLRFIGYKVILKKYEFIITHTLLAIILTINVLMVGSDPIVNPQDILWIANLAWTLLSIMLTMAFIRALAHIFTGCRLGVHKT